MKTISIASLIFSLFMIGSVVASEQFLSTSTTLKISIEEEDRTEHYEYDKPNQFTYVENERKYKGSQAEKALHTLLTNITLSKEVSIDEIVSQLQQKGYKKLTHVEIRWITNDNELFTWVWNSV